MMKLYRLDILPRKYHPGEYDEIENNVAQFIENQGLNYWTSPYGLLNEHQLTLARIQFGDKIRISLEYEAIEVSET